MAKRTIDEQIAGLQARKERDELRLRVKAKLAGLHMLPPTVECDWLRAMLGVEPKPQGEKAKP